MVAGKKVTRGGAERARWNRSSSLESDVDDEFRIISAELFCRKQLSELQRLVHLPALHDVMRLSNDEALPIRQRSVVRTGRPTWLWATRKSSPFYTRMRQTQRDADLADS